VRLYLRLISTCFRVFLEDPKFISARSIYCNMIKRFIPLFFVLFVFYNGFAQLPLNSEEYADSLTKLLKKPLADSTRSMVDFKLSHFWSVQDNFKKAEQYFNEGKKLSAKYPFIDGKSYFFESNLYLEADPKRSLHAIVEGDKKLAFFKTAEAYVFRSKLWYNSAILEQQKDNDKAVIHILLNKVIPLAKLGQDTMTLAKYYSQMGKIFTNNDQYQKAENYYTLAIKLLEGRITKSTILLNTYILGAANYIYQQELPPAKLLLDKARAKLNNYPTSSLWPDYYWTEGNYFEELKDYDRALRSYEEGSQIAKTQHKDYLFQTLKIQKFSVLKKLKKYPEAMKIISEVSADSGYMATSNNRKWVYLEWANLYSAVGNYKAGYQWLERYSEMADSMNNSKLKNDINALEVKYRNAENQQKISTLNAANAQIKAEARNNRLMGLLFGVSSLLLLAISVVIWLTYRNGKRLAKQKEQSHQQELKDIEQQQQIKIAQAMLEGQEEERKRVARDLHDGLGGMLAGIKLNLSDFAVNEQENQQLGLYPIIDQLDTSVTELRRIAHNMMPETLLKFGLETSLRDLCNSMQTNDLNIKLQTYGDLRKMNMQSQISIYRIVQELLSNVVRHAFAKHVLLQCSEENGSFLITIEDDGIGFDAGDLKNKMGMGLINIRNRVDYLDGTFEIISNTEQRGTNINIELNVTT